MKTPNPNSLTVAQTGQTSPGNMSVQNIDSSLAAPPLAMTELTAFNDIALRLSSITPAQITSQERRIGQLNPSSDRLIGIVRSPMARALFTLLAQLDAEHMVEHAATHVAIDPADEAEHHSRAAIADQLGDVVRELMWFQIRSELDAWQPAQLVLRHGWRLVEDTSGGDEGEFCEDCGMRHE